LVIVVPLVETAAMFVVPSSAVIGEPCISR